MNESFNAASVILAMLRSGPLDEVQIIRHVESAEELHFGDAPHDLTDVPRVLFDMVQRGTIKWKHPKGKLKDLETPLVYSIKQ